MTSPPHVSVILPTYNRAQLLARAVASVLSQTFTDFELIVVDDGSTDETSIVLSQLPPDPRIRLNPLSTNSGVSSARNHGIRCARGNWIAFIDSDDEWLTDGLESQLAIAAKFPNAQVVAGASLRLSNEQLSNYVWPTLAPATGAGIVDTEQWFKQGIANFQAVLIQHELMRAVGGFDVALPALEDADVIYRILRGSPDSIVAHSGIVAILHATPASLIANSEGVLQGLRHLIATNGWISNHSPKAYAAMLYRLALHETLDGEFRRSRELAYKAVRHHPGYWRYWLFLMLSISGPRITQNTRHISQNARRLIKSIVLAGQK